MKFYIIAGEASGDMHAAGLIKGLADNFPHARFRCWGGDKMQAAGAEVVKHYRDLAFMGFWEVLSHLPTILRNLKTCRQDILDWKPDALILVDYPGFNMRIAGFARKQGIKVYYYIAPQVWAWKKKRIHKIHQTTDLPFVVMPFELASYEKHHYPVAFAGHPLPDALDQELLPDKQTFFRNHNLDQRKLIALIPGSRRQEIKHILPVMCRMIGQFPEAQFVIAAAPEIPHAWYESLTSGYPVKIVAGHTHALMAAADAAAVASGTATLETALLGTPQVVCYRMSFLTALVAWMLVKVKYISLVNLILDKPAVKELIQYRFTANTLAENLRPLLNDTPIRKQMLTDYDELKKRVGTKGASARAAKIITNHLKDNCLPAN